MEQEANNIPRIKFIILGNSGVGKTYVLYKFIHPGTDTICVTSVAINYDFKDLTIDGHEVRLIITDTAGQERFRSLADSYYRSVDAAIIIYDVTDRDSFDKIPEWINAIKVNALNPDIPVMIIGNKIDLRKDLLDQALQEEEVKKR